MVVKTAVSIPEDVVRHADRVTDRLGWSRSQLYAHALEEFLTQHEGDPVTEALDSLADELGAEAGMNTGRALIDGGRWEW